MAEHSSAELEGIKLQFETLLTEYKMVRDLVADYRHMQGQLDSIALASLGISIPFILAILNQGANAVGAILLIPILFSAIAFTQLRHERLLTIAAGYVDAELRPQIDNLLSELQKNPVSVLGFERHLSRHNWVPRLVLQWIAVASHAVLSLSVSIGMVAIYFYVRLAIVNTTWESYEPWLLIVDGLMLVGNLIIAFAIARMRYAYLQQYYNSAHTEPIS